MELYQSDNVKWHRSLVSQSMRNIKNGHLSPVIWFTGLSGSGKSTLAHSVEKALFDMGCQAYVLDGDNVRHGLCGDLGFSATDRTENLRRIAEVAKLMTDAGIIILAAFISPSGSDREKVKKMFGNGGFLEVYCRCDPDICESRDVKGVYKKAKNGEIDNFTGVSSPYDVPLTPDLVLDTANDPLNECVEKVLVMIREYCF
ncbi:adenylyl-sulfate kinase [Desulforegula conservatrix]|uniref:adenylyl-sulfate kinase n=1 Tax=Desulforegula conservatrix TaxID=153026 RepID=UPI000425FD71|nr:adenylyl-sulfate kinase [Desulforegula conservatrix]